MTYEKSRSTWNNGFRGYKDNSPEAKQRRREDEMYRVTVRILRKIDSPFFKKK